MIIILNKKKKKQITEIQNYFDSEYYGTKYSEQIGDMDPWVHYVKYGYKKHFSYSLKNEYEGVFDADYYLNRYDDVKKNGCDPWEHFAAFGINEGRFCSSDAENEYLQSISTDELDLIRNSVYFDSEWYSSMYSRQLKKSHMSPEVDFYVNGKKEMRNPGPFFNTREFYELNSDLAEDSINPLVYYETYGKKENRKIQYAFAKTIVKDRKQLFDRYDERINSYRELNRAINVVFLISMSSMFAGRRVFELMYNDSKFNARLFVVPDMRYGNERMIETLMQTYKELSEEFENVELAVDVENGVIVNYKDIVAESEIVCYSSPYDVSVSLYNPAYSASLGIPSFHMNYYYMGTTFYDNYVFSLWDYNNFWRVFLENERVMEDYEKNGLCKGYNARISGYAKMDRLLSENYEKKHRKMVIIAPHHSIQGGANDELGLSNFEEYSDLIIQLPQMYPDIDFVFRPHPMLMDALKQPYKWGSEATESYIENLKSFPNMKYSTEGDYMPLFNDSDGMIHDCGSYLKEYFYTDKPQCYVLKDVSTISDKHTEFGQLCINNCYQAMNREDIISFIDDVIIGDNDYMKTDRLKFANEEVKIKYPHSSEFIVNNIKESIGY